MANPATTQSITDLPAAIDSYVNRAIERFAITLRAQLAELREPTAHLATDRALRQCGFLIETLAGFARGAALAPIVQLAKTLGAPRADLDRAALADSVAPPIAVIGPAIADADRRPLVDMLGAHLHRRLAFDVHAIRAHARRMLRTVTDPVRARAMLEILEGDTAPALRFADQIAYGWRTLGAALVGAPAPAIEHVRSRDLWHGWLRTVRRERLVATEAPRQIGATAVTEWIMQIS